MQIVIDVPIDTHYHTKKRNVSESDIKIILEAISKGTPFPKEISKNTSFPKEHGWIPVSERLPETNDDVLVTDGVDMFVAWYSRKDMWQGWMSSDNNFERNTPIEAWMPLPEPYKEESEEV